MSVGFTPWELASLKVMFHRFDDTHKGYLDAADLHRVCVACHLVLTQEEFDRVLSVMDADGDNRYSFDEFVTFLALSGPEHPEVVRIRAEALRGDRAAWSAGAALGVLPMLKGKLVVFLGTMFYDPVRLFRDTFVDYSTTLRARMRGCSVPSEHATLWAVIRAHTRETHVLKTMFWLTYTVTLDCMVGVVMFVTYAKARCFLVDHSEVFHGMKLELKRLKWRSPSQTDADTLGGHRSGGDSATLSSSLGLLSQYLQDEERREYCLSFAKDRFSGFLHQKPLRIEFLAGLIGGAAAGVAEPVFRYLAQFGTPVDEHTTEKTRRRRSLIGGGGRWIVRQWPFSVARSAAGHAAFFAAFYGTRAQVYYTCFGTNSYFQWNRTSVRDSLVTAAGGCFAGAAYRTIALPMNNLHLSRKRFYRTRQCPAQTELSTSSSSLAPNTSRWLAATLREHGARHLVTQVAFAGYGQSLLYTMPVTGVAFLIYELTLLHSS